MKQNVSFSQFCDAFRDHGREDKFTYKGKRALYDYLEEYESDTGEDIELDVIALCCEYSEYPSAWDAMKEYKPEDMPVIDLEDLSKSLGSDPDLIEVREAEQKAAREWLSERTQVIDVADGGIIIQQF